MHTKELLNKENLNYGVILLAVIILAVTGYYLFAQFADYTYESSRHVADIFRLKLWSMVLILIFTAVLYSMRNSKCAPAAAILAVSIYFIIFYAILYRGTQYGLNGHWGDNGYRLAAICKMMAYNNFSDAYLKGLTAMYPPLWSFIMALYAKILGLEAWQTLKFGYLFTFLVYPWLVYFMWRLLVSSRVAAAVTIAIIFFAHKHLNYVNYEHVTAALFLPWWLYYFEDGKDIAIGRGIKWRFYIIGGLIGGVLAMTYYYWFFMVAMAVPLTIAVRFLYEKSWRDLLLNIRHKAILTAGVILVSTPFWFPLLRQRLEYGFESSQVTWFGLRHADLTARAVSNPLEGALILAGVFFAAYLWNRWHHARLILLYCGGLLVIIADRILNLGGHSIQSRKILEFTHIFTMAPLAVGAAGTLWESLGKRPKMRWGLVALAVVLALTYANEHTEVYKMPVYKAGANQRIPKSALEVFEDIDCHNKVFLTNSYIEACYYPYYMFVTVSNAPAHLAGRFSERIDFLKASSRIKESDLLAYVMTYNRFDKIDYVYLILNGNDNCYDFRYNVISFNSEMVQDTVSFPYALFMDSDHFVKAHPRNLFEVRAEERDKETDDRIKNEYPEVYDFLARRDRNS